MNTLVGVGIAIIIGYFLGKLINKVNVPSVAGYVIAGLILGQSCLKIFGTDFIDNTSVVSDVALALIAFSIGGELLKSNLQKIGIRVFIIAFFEGFAAFVFVTFAMRFLMKQDLATSLLLGSVASATAPAATVMVIHELKAKGPLADTLTAVVAIDDAICLMIYAVASSVAKVLIANTGEAIQWGHVMLQPVIEIGGSLILGAVIGAILVFILRYVNYTSEILAVVIAAIFITQGLATILDFSALLCNMMVGVMVTNFSTNRTKTFSTIESITSPIYTAFFVLAGARLNIAYFLQIGVVGIVYTIARMLGKVLGASFGATITKADPMVKKYIGFGLLSQIGVAVGLAIIISHEFSGTDAGNLILTVLLATTVITEIVGPLCTRYAIIKSGERGAAERVTE